MRKMKIFAMGGAGGNVAARFLKFQSKANHGFSEIECVFVDTSKSNLSPNIPASQIYLVDNLDGSGKLRASNYQVLNECSKDILLQHKPADLNVILSSGGGGSGSVLGPIVTSELLGRGETVIVITIGSTSSRKETDNTLKTLHSYEKISQLRNKPVVMAYRENSASTPRGHIDAEVDSMILTLSAIFSGDNRELDMSDLRNFLNYHLVTSFTPKLTYLDITSGSVMLSKGQALVSLVTLTDDSTSSDVDVLAEYQAVGFIPDAAKENLGIAMPLHAAVITGYFNGVAERLEAKLATYDEVRHVVIEKSIAGKDTATTDDGLVL